MVASPASEEEVVAHAASTAPVALSTEDRLEYEQNIIAVFQLSAPATVHIALSRPEDVKFGDTEMVPGTGTGFIWDTDGHIVTNYHVVDHHDTENFFVTLYNQRTYKAELLGGDPNKDVAVLKLEDNEEDLTPIRLPDSGAPTFVGQTAIAIGNPFGLDHTLTVGVVSALGRNVPGYGGVTIRGMIQTDASINPGNSGGPLLDSQGRLLGMNTMILRRSSGIGFAVPVDIIRRVTTQIISKGRVDHPGIGAIPMPGDLAARVGIRGVLLMEILPGSPAERAGLKSVNHGKDGLEYGDIIVAVDGTEVGSYDDLYNAFDTHEVGDVVEVRIRRAKKTVELSITLVDVNER